MKKFLSLLIPLLVLTLVPCTSVYPVLCITSGPLGSGVVDGTAPFVLAHTNAAGTPLHCDSPAE